MTPEQQRALRALRFNWALVPDDVWQDIPFHVEGLHPEAVRIIEAGIQDADESSASNPIGVVMQGQAGTGKTHLLGWVRERVQRAGGYFFLIGLLSGETFWSTSAASVIDGLVRRTPAGTTQLTEFLSRLATRVGLAGDARAAVTTGTGLGSEHVEALVNGLRELDRSTATECADTLRALAMLNSADPATVDLGNAFLSGLELAAEPRVTWHLQATQKLPVRIVQEVSRLLALTGPAVVAVDQVDAVIAQAAKGTDAVGETRPASAQVIEQVAGGVMELREITRRTLTLLACLPVSWTLIQSEAVNTASARFREALQLRRIPSVAVGEELVAKRFTAAYAKVAFTPAYPTWPVARSAFADVQDFTPRLLLQRIDQHVQRCLTAGVVTELATLTSDIRPPDPEPEPPAQGILADLDAEFARRLSAVADPAGLEPMTEDAVMPELLAAGLRARIAELAGAVTGLSIDPPPSTKPKLHARLVQVLDEATEESQHWALRAIASPSAVAVQTRIRNATDLAGLTSGVAERRLILLRNTAWPNGPKTKEMVDEFHRRGGRTLPVDIADLRTFAVLRDMLAGGNPLLPEWLVARRPASSTALFGAVFGDSPAPVSGNARSTVTAGPGNQAGTNHNGAGRHAHPGDERAAAAGANRGRHAVVEPEPDPDPEPEIADGVPRLTVGLPLDGTAVPARITLESLRRHTTIFAGSGSGKTVLIRRLIEECALLGVSSIVLDPNNDLARLGDAWPTPPAAWGPGDSEKAKEYLVNTDVVLWTPRIRGGRPLSFQPLPDFSTMLDNPDEFDQAIDAAVATLAPRAKMDGTTDKASQGRAVLTEALRYYARKGGTADLRSFIAVLSALPDGVSQLEQGEKLAGQMAESLKAATVTDPLFAGGGAPVDPGLLLTPPAGKRARVSVISLAGLSDEGQRQGFVNQLQLALFGWFKRHPAGDRPLGGLFVMDEAQIFVPSVGVTPSTHSTLMLSSQVRKYGLGLVYATQAPKGLHNRIPGNSATQFYGLLTAQIQIDAAKSMASARNGRVDGIGELRQGQFYAAADDLGFRKLQTPLCLSHHPSSPLTTEEVVERARLGAV